MTIVLLFMTRKDEQEQPYLLVLHIPTSQDSKEVLSTVKNSVQRYMLKSKTITPAYQEITAEIRLKDDNTDFLNQLQNDNKVQKATIITYSGDLSAVWWGLYYL